MRKEEKKKKGNVRMRLMVGDLELNFGVVIVGADARGYRFGWVCGVCDSRQK